MNTLGRIFRVSLFGESHGSCVGALIDGCPPGLKPDPAALETELARRRPGRPGTTERREPDVPRFLSGVMDGRTTGAPLAVVIENRDARPGDYDSFRAVPRPGHADYTARIKYRGFNDPRGGGYFSGRLTAALVAAGHFARLAIRPISVAAELTSAGGSAEIEKAVADAMADGDSVGGEVVCRATSMPAGLGNPWFGSLESRLAQAIFAMPGVRGVAFGDGFDAAARRGSEHNDPYLDARGRTAANHAGGVNGGISNGNDLVIRVAVKPTSSIARAQETFDFEAGRMTALETGGRHDACFALRTPVIVEALTAIVLADEVLLAGKERTRPGNPDPE